MKALSTRERRAPTARSPVRIAADQLGEQERDRDGYGHDGREHGDARSRSRTITTAAIPPPGRTRMRSPPLSPRRSRRARAGRRPRRDPSPTGRDRRRLYVEREHVESVTKPYGKTVSEQAARSTDRRCARGARGGSPRPPRLGAAVPGRARRLPKTPQLAIAGVGSGRRVGRARRLQLRAPERLTRSRPRGSGCCCEGVRAVDLLPFLRPPAHVRLERARSSAGVGSLSLAW